MKKHNIQKHKSNIMQQIKAQASNAKIIIKSQTKKHSNSISDEGITPIVVEPEPFNPLRKINAF